MCVSTQEIIRICVPCRKGCHKAGIVYSVTNTEALMKVARNKVDTIITICCCSHNKFLLQIMPNGMEARINWLNIECTHMHSHIIIIYHVLVGGDDQEECV